MSDLTERLRAHWSTEDLGSALRIGKAARAGADALDAKDAEIARLTAERDAAWNEAIDAVLNVGVRAMSDDYCEECKGRGETAMLAAIRELKR